MRGLTYPDLAARYEIDACFDGCFRNDHWGGGVDQHGVLHWADRSVRRPGLRRFLMLVSEAERRGWQRGVILSRKAWRERAARDIHHDHMFAYYTAFHDLGVRLPAKLAEADKAKVRHLLANAPFDVRNSKVGRWAGMR